MGAVYIDWGSDDKYIRIDVTMVPVELAESNKWEIE